MNVVASLKRKLGPLPAWGWLAGLAGVLLIWRRLHPSSASTTPLTGDAGAIPLASTAGGLGAFGAGGSGGGDGGLTPSDQGIVTPNGPGTPMIFDPLGGNNDTQFGGPARGQDQQDPAPPFGSNAGTGTGTGNNDTIDPGDAGGTARGRHAPTASGGAPTKPVGRPKSSRGQRTKKSRHVTIQPQTHTPVAVAHPASAAHASAPAPVRPQTHTPPAPTVQRSTASAHVDSGARAVAAPPAPAKKAAPPPASNVHRPGRQM